MNKEEVVTELFKDFDLGLYADLFGWWFVSDSKCILYSPSFRDISGVHEWMFNHREFIRKELS